MKAQFWLGLAFFLPLAQGKSQGLIIPQGISMVANGGNILLDGNWTNNGTFKHNDGAVIFTGDSQSVTGSAATVFNNITIAEASTTTIASGQYLKGYMICDGMLYANGNLTLLSTSEQTALIDGTGKGEVLGNVSMQRYLAHGFGYKYFSSPYNDATVGEFSDDIDLQSAFPAFYKYDETRTSSGWVDYTDPTGLLLPLRGYAANVGNSLQEKTVEIAGVVNNGDISAVFYNSGKTFTEGFNLVGNPYPSPIDWDSAAGWDRTNIDDAIYYFDAGITDPYLGTYSSYINGISSDGMANNIIPAMQGFFVHVSNGTYPVSGNLGINNNARVNNLIPVFHKPAPETRAVIRLSAASGESADPVVVYFDDKATVGFDKSLDALKLMNTDTDVPNLYARTGDKKISIYALPGENTGIDIVPLGVTMKKDGTVNFVADAIERMPPGLKPYFVDIQTGTVQDMYKNNEYQVILTSGAHENRFFLVFSTGDISEQSFFRDAFSVSAFNGKIYVHLNMASGGKGLILITNMAGQIVMREKVDGFGTHEFDAGWSTGMYIVTLVSDDNKYSKKVSIIN